MYCGMESSVPVTYNRKVEDNMFTYWGVCTVLLDVRSRNKRYVFLILDDSYDPIPEDIPVDKLEGYQFCLSLGYKDDDIKTAYEANESK